MMKMTSNLELRLAEINKMPNMYKATPAQNSRYYASPDYVYTRFLYKPLGYQKLDHAWLL